MAEAAFHPGGEAHLPLQGLDQGEGFRLVVEALGEAFQAGKEFLLGDLPRLGQAVEGEEEVGEGGEGFGGEGLGGEGPSGEAAGDEDAPLRSLDHGEDQAPEARPGHAAGLEARQVGLLLAVDLVNPFAVRVDPGLKPA